MSLGFHCDEMNRINKIYHSLILTASLLVPAYSSAPWRSPLWLFSSLPGTKINHLRPQFCVIKALGHRKELDTPSSNCLHSKFTNRGNQEAVNLTLLFPLFLFSSPYTSLCVLFKALRSTQTQALPLGKNRSFLCQLKTIWKYTDILHHFKYKKIYFVLTFTPQTLLMKSLLSCCQVLNAYHVQQLHCTGFYNLNNIEMNLNSFSCVF